MCVTNTIGGEHYCANASCRICSMLNAGHVSLAELDALDGIAAPAAAPSSSLSVIDMDVTNTLGGSHSCANASCRICNVVEASHVSDAELDALDGIFVPAAASDSSSVLGAMDAFSSPCQSPTRGICPGRDSGKLCMPSSVGPITADSAEAIDIALKAISVSEELLSLSEISSLNLSAASSCLSSPTSSVSGSDLDSDSALELACQALAVTENLLAQGPSDAIHPAEDGIEAKLAALAAEKAVLEAEHGTQFASGTSSPVLLSPTTFENEINSAVARSIAELNTGRSHLAAPAVASPTLTAEELADADEEAEFLIAFDARNAEIEASISRQDALLSCIMGPSSPSKIPVRVGGRKPGVSRVIRLAGPLSPTSSLSHR